MRRLMACTGSLLLSGVLLTPLVAQTQTPERSRTEGLKETDKFVKAGGDTSQAVANAKTQMQKTLDVYNALVTQPSKNMKGDYKKLMKSLDGMNDRVAEARQKVDQMQQAGDTTSPAGRPRSRTSRIPSCMTSAQQRLSDTQKQFAPVLGSLRETAQALEPFRKQVADQITFLGSDLTPSAVTALKPTPTSSTRPAATCLARPTRPSRTRTRTSRG